MTRESAPGGNPTAQGSQRAVFLSYASEDANAAQRMCTALRAAGIEVWLDQSELRGGDAWDAAIRRQIKSCALFVALISANTRARVEGYFRLEWKLAVDRSHLMAAERTFLLPVVIDGTPDTDFLVPDKFHEVQWTRAPAGELPAAFIERVSHLLSPTHPRSGPTVSPSPGPGPAAAAPRRTRRRRVWTGVAALVALVVAGAVTTYQWQARRTAIRLVAVLPFENATGDAAIDYLGDGISESLINKLSSLSGLRVISRTSAFAFRGQKLGPTEIGRKLGVDALVLGSLAQRGQTLAITAELVRVRDATQLWGEKYARPADDVLQLEGEMATTIAEALHRQLTGDEKLKLARAETSDPEAYRLYLRGRNFLVGTQLEMDKSVEYFQQAIARAPGYAMAHAGLADAYTVQAFLRASGRTEAVGKARAAVTRALELDPDLGEAHAALARVRYLFEWDWAGADNEFRRALSLSPGSEDVHEAYGSFLITMLRLDEGLAESREAARLDPLSVRRSTTGDQPIGAGQLRGGRGGLPAHDRHRPQLDLGLHQARPDARHPEEVPGGVRASRDRGAQDRGRCRSDLAIVARRHVRDLRRHRACTPEARRAARAGGEAVRRPDGLRGHPHEPRRTAGALECYERALTDRSPGIANALLVARLYPQLATNPRYTAILARMGFPPSAR